MFTNDWYCDGTLNLLFLPLLLGGRFDGCLVVYGLDDGACGTLVQIVEFAHVLLANLKVVDVCVFLDSARGIALGKRDLRNARQHGLSNDR